MNFNFIVRAQSLLLEAAVATEDSPITSHQKKKIVVWTSLTFHFITFPLIISYELSCYRCYGLLKDISDLNIIGRQ